MERIALITQSGILYWNDLIITLAVLGSVCGFLWLYLTHSKTPAAGFVAAPLALALSLLLSRLLHWYVYAETYPSLWTALTDYTSGGFVLMGAFMGCVLSTVLTRQMGLHRNSPQMLDYMCLAGGAAMAVGRLSSFFNASARGQIIHSTQSLPWVYPVVNAVSGVLEYRLATFLLQAAITAIITAALMVFYHRRSESVKNGDVTLLFLLCYCATQFVLDSTRYDSVYLRSNGFISIVQVACAVTMVSVIVVLSLRMVKMQGLRVWHLLLWTGMLPMLGTAGYMEYHVQRHGDQAPLSYTIMSLCLAAVVAMTVFIYRHGQKSKNM